MKIAGQYAYPLLDREDFHALCRRNAEISFDMLKASVVRPPESSKQARRRTPVYAVFPAQAAALYGDLLEVDGAIQSVKIVMDGECMTST